MLRRERKQPRVGGLAPAPLTAVLIVLCASVLGATVAPPASGSFATKAAAPRADGPTGAPVATTPAVARRGARRRDSNPAVANAPDTAAMSAAATTPAAAATTPAATATTPAATATTPAANATTPAATASTPPAAASTPPATGTSLPTSPEPAAPGASAQPIPDVGSTAPDAVPPGPPERTEPAADQAKGKHLPTPSQQPTTKGGTISDDRPAPPTPELRPPRPVVDGPSPGGDTLIPDPASEGTGSQTATTTPRAPRIASRASRPAPTATVAPTTTTTTTTAPSPPPAPAPTLTATIPAPSSIPPPASPAPTATSAAPVDPTPTALAPAAPATAPQPTAFGAGRTPAAEPDAIGSWQMPAIGSTTATSARSSAPGSPAVHVSAIVSADANATIRQVDPARGMDALTWGSVRPVAQAPATLTRRSTARHLSKATAPAQGGGMGPDAPPGPPGHATAAASAAAFGGIGSAYWCAILAGVLALSCRRLRRHRARLVLPGPVGVPFLLQRPG